jgi:ubiquinone/menaquinone biosynthesis C-methylase UbiE
MVTTQTTRTAPPLKIMALMYSQWENQILKTALQLDLFSHIQHGSNTISALSTKLSLDPRGLELLLNALTSMEFMEKTGDKYSLTLVTADYLVKESDLYFGKFILERGNLTMMWDQLTDAISSGKPRQQVNQDQAAEQFFPGLAAAIFPLNFSTAQMVADELNISQKDGPIHVLDLAAGSAVWSIPFAQASRNVKIDALDFPAVLKVTDEFATKYGVKEQYTFLSGNWRDVSLEKGKYDYIILGHILHSEGVELSAQLLKVCADSLKTGGTLIIAEMFSNEERTSPSSSQIFAVNMFLATTTGCVFTENELKNMVQAAGMKNAHRLPLSAWGDQSPIMIANK